MLVNSFKKSAKKKLKKPFSYPGGVEKHVITIYHLNGTNIVHKKKTKQRERKRDRDIQPVQSADSF